MPEGKKDAHKKTTPASPSTSKTGKKSETGIWPCKIDGCNREFAREADLKRHQRTTKNHTQPSFSCPQCDAKFTRTDALRRHQKSRHNGIIIETPLSDKGKGLQMFTVDGETPAGGSGRSPDSKTYQGVFTPLTPASLAQFAIPGPPPPGYYRQNGMNTEFLVFVPARATMEGSVISNPAAPQGQWMPLPPNWPTEGHIPVSFQPIPGVPPGFFAPTYYRPTPGGTASMFPMFPPSGQAPEGGASGSSAQSGDMEQQMQNGGQGGHGQGRAGEASGSVIDPNLQANGSNGATNAASSHPHPPPPGPQMGMSITQAAIHAVMMAAQRDHEQYWLYHNLQAALQLPQTPLDQQQPQQPQPLVQDDDDADADGDADEDLDADGEMDVDMDVNAGHNSVQQNHHGGHRQLPHMLTEDGEPMLNPAELLTQESLASPPPS